MMTRENASAIEEVCVLARGDVDSSVDAVPHGHWPARPRESFESLMRQRGNKHMASAEQVNSAPT